MSSPVLGNPSAGSRKDNRHISSLEGGRLYPHHFVALKPEDSLLSLKNLTNETNAAESRRT